MEIRRLEAKEFEQAIRLADDTFREEGHLSMGQAFPHVFSTVLKQSYGAFDGEKLVSFIGLVPGTIRVGEATLSVFSLGSVCTHEAYRQQGISTMILQEIYHNVDEATASLILVSGDRGMYLRNQCYRFGKTYAYTIGKTSEHKGEYEGEVRKGQPSDILQIDCLRRATNVRFDSSIWEWQVLIKAGGYSSIFKMDQALYVACNGVVEGYAVIAMPTPASTKDHAIVIEWGGNSKAVYGILQNMLEANPVKEIKLTIPWHEKFFEEVSEYPCEELQNAGTIHIVNAVRLIEQLKPYLCARNPALAHSLSVEQVDDHHVILHYNHESKIVLTLEDLVRLLFDPQGENLDEELQTIFPIPLPYTEGMYFV
ncbi:GNAT family N-acetyltransferase [Sporosarcina sp. NPDC096371]|uniref:GNAT family N-acetyltransferase n=1 Tax=Sporosarcina sp. NPDC096371 TaxID=3364530 RepID=UPI0037FFDA5D